MSADAPICTRTALHKPAAISMLTAHPFRIETRDAHSNPTGQMGTPQ